MRILAYLLLVLILASITLTMLVILGWIESFVSSTWSEARKGVTNETANLVDQLIAAMTGGKEMAYRGVEIGLLMAFIALVVAVFAYSRRR